VKSRNTSWNTHQSKTSPEYSRWHPGSYHTFDSSSEPQIYLSQTIWNGYTNQLNLVSVEKINTLVYIHKSQHTSKHNIICYIISQGVPCFRQSVDSTKNVFSKIKYTSHSNRISSHIYAMKGHTNIERPVQNMHYIYIYIYIYHTMAEKTMTLYIYIIGIT
jgi:hypothetical protein